MELSLTPRPVWNGVWWMGGFERTLIVLAVVVFTRVNNRQSLNIYQSHKTNPLSTIKSRIPIKNTLLRQSASLVSH